MEIIDGNCYLTIGDKVKSVKSDEGGEVIDIIDKEHAKIEFFDEVMIMNHKELKPLSLLSTDQFNHISFYRATKKIKNKKKVQLDIIADRIDLHAESLFAEHRAMSAENIAIKQILSLDHFIHRAINSSHNSLTIVHGKGTGSLRSQVIDLLENKYHLFDLDLSNPGKTIVYL